MEQEVWDKGETLTTASKLVTGDRNDEHGDVENSFAAIAQVWTAYLDARRDKYGPVRAHDVCHMMVLLKQQRAEWGKHTRDHYVDQAGYAAIAGELVSHIPTSRSGPPAPRIGVRWETPDEFTGSD